jgi:hypothetical protein
MLWGVFGKLWVVQRLYPFGCRVKTRQKAELKRIAFTNRGQPPLATKTSWACRRQYLGKGCLDARFDAFQRLGKIGVIRFPGKK